MSYRPQRVTLAVVCAMLASVVVAACGGAQPTADKPLSSASQTGNDALTFATRMREHGVHAGTSSSGPAGLVRGGVRIMHKALEARRDAWEEDIHSVPPPYRGYQADKAAATASRNLMPAVRKFSECMREHGIKPLMESEPTTTWAKLVQRARREHPAVEKAKKACQDLMPLGMREESEIEATRQRPAGGP